MWSKGLSIMTKEGKCCYNTKKKIIMLKCFVAILKELQATKKFKAEEVINHCLIMKRSI